MTAQDLSTREIRMRALDATMRNDDELLSHYLNMLLPVERQELCKACEKLSAVITYQWRAR